MAPPWHEVNLSDANPGTEFESVPGFASDLALIYQAHHCFSWGQALIKTYKSMLSDVTNVNQKIVPSWRLFLLGEGLL